MPSFESNILSIYGDRGRVWLMSLPEVRQKYASDWGLSCLQLMENLTYNYVLSGFQGEQPIILKLSLDEQGLQREARALKAFGENGAVKVLAQQDGALLLERAIPGDSLKSLFPLKDHEAVEIVCKVMQKLHQSPLPEEGLFPHVKEWLNTLDKDWDIPHRYLQRARELREFLLATSADFVLLHADLHHDNVIRNGDDWLAIDPKGVIGEPAFEAAVFIRNPVQPDLLNHPEAISIISHRIVQFSQTLGVDKNRLLQWCFVESVLSWAWNLEDGCDTVCSRRLTEMIDEILLLNKERCL